MSGEASLVDALGGPRGFIDSALPGIVFVSVFTVTREVEPSAIAAVATAAGLVALRIIRRETLQHALSGVIGVAICAFIAQRSGRAENFYLPGLLINMAYAAAYVVSILVRWPILGIALGPLLGEGMAWRRDPARLRAYSRASWVWVAMFLLRIAVQAPLWAVGAVTALGVARVAMGLPMFALAAWISYLILRRVPTVRLAPLVEEAAEPVEVRLAIPEHQRRQVESD
jgi:hypothetical protein